MSLAGARRLVVLDDDPTGTQTVRDLPVLTGWSVDDVRWALQQPTAGFFVLTNTRSLSPADARARNQEVVRGCLAAAEQEGVPLAFASRGDSTLRGHYPLETDAIAELVDTDAVLLVPAYLDAGRVTVRGLHYLRSGDELIPVADSEFARDATFGYRSSRLADWVEEKSGGRISSAEVTELTIDTIRAGAADTVLTGARGVIAVDAEVEDDLRAVVLAVLTAERAGTRFIYRVGPSFVRARVGQHAAAPISDEQLASLVGPGHGLVGVGSHVGLTSRQLDRLAARHAFTAVELDVPTLIDDAHADEHISAAVAEAADADNLVVLSTSRTLITGEDEAASLDIARRVSAALTRTVREIRARRQPSFVIAKGGITSADVAKHALGIDRAWVRGSLLPGIVSLWESTTGLPYVVFAGNVGGDESLADVVDRLERA